MDTTLLTTALHDWHVDHDGTMVDFAHWSMPVRYGSIIDEHMATRQAAGLFDVSHMGRFRLEGEGPDRLLDSMVTRGLLDMKLGQIRYGLMTNDQGGILDDVLVYRLREEDGRPFHLLVVNAGNRAKIWDWIQQHTGDFSGTVRDLTEATAMIAVQGPAAIELVAPHLNVDLPAMRYYRGVVCQFDGTSVIASRTGYTGEDGCELIVPSASAVAVWQRLLDEGQQQGVRPAGLGARDTLRLEAAMPLYGHELNEQITPYEADLGFAVTLGDHHFIGRQAVEQARDDATRRIRVGLRPEGKRPAREGCTIHATAGDGTIGEVTSGTTSPTLGYPIAMGYLDRSHSAIGTSVEIDIRGRREAASVVALPFYQRPQKG